MSLMELFSGNPGNPIKKVGVTALAYATQGGNLGNPENVVIKTQYDKVESLVTCYTPAGNPVQDEASSPEHAAFLQRMNPRPQ